MRSFIPVGDIGTTALQTALYNYEILLAGINSYFQNPNQANLATITNLATAAQCTLPPKRTYTVDGENDQWKEYQEMVITQMGTLRQQLQRAFGPFVAVS